MWPVPKWSSSHRSASPDASLCRRAAFAASTRRHTSDNDVSSINPPVAYYACPQTVRLVRHDQSTRGDRDSLFTGVRRRGVLRSCDPTQFVLVINSTFEGCVGFLVLATILVAVVARKGRTVSTT